VTAVLSVGVLYSCQDFLELCVEQPFTLDAVRESFTGRFSVASFDAVLGCLRECGWITFDECGRFLVTSAGAQITCAGSRQAALQFQVRDYIDSTKPTWSGLISQGREEAMSYFPTDVSQVFKEAGLAGNYDDEVVAWWDSAALIARGRLSDLLTQIGRTGERLSREFEFNRTGQLPKWVAVDSNLAGYDLLSVVSREDDRPLRIEVKATSQTDKSASFFLSRGEWDCASSHGDHVFHFWRLKPQPRVTVVGKASMASHIPRDFGSGAWKQVKVSFLQAPSDHA
jgi:hypothetical protein